MIEGGLCAIIEDRASEVRSLVYPPLMAVDYSSRRNKNYGRTLNVWTDWKDLKCTACRTKGYRV